MKSKLIFACIVSLLIISSAYAEDNPISGGIFLGGRAINQNQQSANFNQYNSITPGMFGGGYLNYDKDKYYFMADGAYLGENDFYARAKGGRWGDFKYSLYFQEWPHNLSFEDKSIFATPGSTAQGLAPGATTTSLRNINTWPSQSFDYKYVRKEAGGTFDLTMIRPFFFNVDANQLRREGQRPFGANGTPLSPGGLVIEMAVPIDDVTTNVNGTFGWKSKQYYAAFSSGYSKYDNKSEYTTFITPSGTAATAGANTIAGAPDNWSYFLKFTGNAKLPLSSTFALTGGYQNNHSQTSLLNTFGNLPTVRAGQNNFNGSVEYWNVAASLTSNPWKNLTTKLYYKYIDRKNNSDTVDFFDRTTGAFLSSNEIFDYQKTTYGVEAAYRFTNKLKGIVGYEFWDLQRRARESELGEVHEDPTSPEQAIPETWANTYNAQLVYNPLDWLGTRLKYQRMVRGAQFNMASVSNPLNPAEANDWLNNNFRAYYAANKTQDMIKATFDLTPIQNLDVALEYAFKHDTYDKQVLGFYKAQQNEFILDGSYDWKGVKFFGFFDYDVTWTDQQTRNVGVTTTPPLPNAFPAAAPNANSYNFRVNLRNDNYAYGAGTSFPIIKKKLTFALQYDFQKNNGTADFTSQFLTTSTTAAFGRNADLLNMLPWDDYTMQSISARMMYDFDQHLGLMFGWVYRQMKYNDAQIPSLDPNQTSTVINGYRYVMPATGSPSALLSGAYTDQNYNANIFFLKAMYKF
jgi:MtrB/PioB family decaheme-associated outer membrane protein